MRTLFNQLMMFKRVSLVLVAIIIAASFAGCGKDECKINDLNQEPEVRAKSARDGGLTLCQMEDFLKDPDWLVRSALIENANVTVDILKKLAKDPAEIVRRNAARHPLMPVESLQVLVKDDRFRVRLATTENPNTPIEALNILSTDEDERVQAAAKKALDARASDTTPEETPSE